MARLVFSRFWGDPAEHLDEIRALNRRVEQAERTLKEQERRHNARRIRKLIKMAKGKK